MCNHTGLKYIRVIRYTISILSNKSLQATMCLMVISILLVSLLVTVSTVSLKLNKLYNQISSLSLYIFTFLVTFFYIRN